MGHHLILHKKKNLNVKVYDQIARFLFHDLNVVI